MKFHNILYIQNCVHTQGLYECVSVKIFTLLLGDLVAGMGRGGVTTGGGYSFY